MSENLARFTESMIERYGELLGGRQLSHVIGYQSIAAMKMAVRRKKLSLPVFPIPGRPGLFALTVDVAAWIFDLSQKADSHNEPLGGRDGLSKKPKG